MTSPHTCPDEIIAAIRAREHRGTLDLRRERKWFKAGDRVQMIDGILAGRRGYYAGETPKHVKVLLQMLGSERQVRVSSDHVRVPQRGARRPRSIDLDQEPTRSST